MKEVWNEIKRLEKRKKIHFFVNLVMIVVSAVLQVAILQIFMDPINIISGGFTGLSLLCHKLLLPAGIHFPVWFGILLFNTPAAYFCGRSVSKRFVLLSVIQYVLVSLFMIVLHFKPLGYDIVLNVLFGGVLWGFSISLSLRAGGSTGGTDFIAQYVSNKINKGIWDYIFIFNCIMYVIFGLFAGWQYAGYSIVFQFISTKTISSLYQRYSQITLEFYTEEPEILRDTFMACCCHGMTIFEAQGGYEHKKVYMCKSIVSVYEAKDAIQHVRDRIPNVIVNTYRTASFYGNFHQQPIE